MKVIPIDHGLDLLASELIRSPGLHMSQIYGDMYSDLEPKRFVRGSKPNELMMAIGSAWENHIAMLRRKAGICADRPGEFRTVEGIAFSPDMLINNGHMRLGEDKVKWMGTKDLPTEPTNSLPPLMNKDVTQMKSYCYNLDTPYARLYSLFLLGDYKRPYTPQLRAFDIEFTAREMKEEWQRMMNHAKFKRML